MRKPFGHLVAAASGLALGVALFFEWYGLEVGPVEASVSGWESLTVIDIVLAAIAVLAVAAWAARRTGRLDRRPLPVAPELVVAAAGVVAFVLVLLRIADVPDAAAAAELDGRRVGAFLALIASAGIVLGGWAARGERLQAPVVRDGPRGPDEP